MLFEDLRWCMIDEIVKALVKACKACKENNEKFKANQIEI